MENEKVRFLHGAHPPPDVIMKKVAWKTLHIRASALFTLLLSFAFVGKGLKTWRLVKETDEKETFVYTLLEIYKSRYPVRLDSSSKVEITFMRKNLSKLLYRSMIRKNRNICWTFRQSLKFLQFSTR